LEEVTVRVASLSASTALRVALLAPAPARVMVALPLLESASSAAWTQSVCGVAQLEVVKEIVPAAGPRSLSPAVLAALTETVEAG
jgi:hypothetical protein